jgi:hypothetical protein
VVDTRASNAAQPIERIEFMDIFQREQLDLKPPAQNAQRGLRTALGRRCSP